MAPQFFSTWLCSAVRRGHFAWGCRSFRLLPPPGLDQLRLAYLRDRDRGIALERRRLGRDVFCNNRLISINGDVLDRDVLLASASMVVEPFCQHHDCPCCLIG